MARPGPRTGRPHRGRTGQQAAEAPLHPLLNLGRGAAAGVGGDLLACPGPDRLVGVAVGAVGRQADQTQGGVGRGQVCADRVAAMGGAVVPDHDQRPGVVGAPLPEEGHAGRGCAVPGQRPVRDRPALQADGRVVAGLLAPARAGGVDQRGVTLARPRAVPVRSGTAMRRVRAADLRPPRPGSRQQRHGRRDEGGPPRLVGLAQALLRALVSEAASMPGARAGAATEADAATGLDACAHHLPMPVGPGAADLGRSGLHRDLQPPPGRRVADGGGPPVCAQASAAGPSRSQAANRPPLVCASRSSNAATVLAGQPCASSHTAGQRARARGGGARYLRSRACRTSSCQRARTAATSPMLRAPAFHAILDRSIPQRGVRFIGASV